MRDIAKSELMTVQEVSDYLRVTTRTIYNLIDKRNIPAVKVGHQWRFDLAAINTWLHGEKKPLIS